MGRFDSFFKSSNSLNDVGVDISELKSYLRVEHDLDDKEITSMFNVAERYILDYTGMSMEEYEMRLPSLKIVIYMLVASMYDIRGSQLANVTRIVNNPLCDNLLDMYKNNYTI